MINATHERIAQSERIQGICTDILQASRNELYVHMRFLDNALAGLHYVMDNEMRIAGTDGLGLYYEPFALMDLYKSGRERINRLYLHILFHCLFLHIYPEPEVDEQYWSLACDVAVETILDGLFVKAIHIPRSGARRQALKRLNPDGGTVTAQKIYKKLQELNLPGFELGALIAEFRRDDHHKWYEKEKRNPRSMQQKQNWDDIRNKMQTEMETFSKEASDESKSLMDSLRIAGRSQYDYKTFLRKFSVLKEEMKVDMDTFDYIFYHYGMELYGNMPLIEPLETKEEQKVEDFVIVIDTSMSCKGELVEKFLEQTYTILSENESFHRRINVHILQCDERIQQDTLIENAAQLEDYMQNFTLIGQGGTDFRPPFAYVEQLLMEKKFSKLRGLIYFTDGYGTFPAKMPPYETAFVFMEEDYKDIDVPPWAIKLILSKDDLEG